MFIFILVEMELSLSLLRFEFSWYRSIAKKLAIFTSEMETLKENVYELLGSNLEKLEQLNSEVFSKVNWGR